MKKKREKPKSVCPKCLTMKVLTKHHIHPVEYYGRKNNNFVVLICESCHRDIESILPQRKLSRDDYQAITFGWIRGMDITVV